MILRGLLRFTLVLVASAGVTAAIAVLIVWLSGAPAGRTFRLAFYIFGATLLAAGFFAGAAPSSTPYYSRRSEREQGFSSSFVHVAFGICLIGVGVLLDALR
jgi:hypothetical protein